MCVQDAVTASGTFLHSLLAFFISLFNLPESPFAGGKAARSMKLRTKRVHDTDSMRKYDIP